MTDCANTDARRTFVTVKPDYKLATADLVYEKCILKASFDEKDLFYFALDVTENSVLAMPLFQVYDEKSCKFVWSVAAYSGCVEQYNVYKRTRSTAGLPPTLCKFVYEQTTGSLCSGSLHLRVYTTESENKCATVVNRVAHSTTHCNASHQVCGLCGVDNTVAHQAGLLSHVKHNLWAHALCLSHSAMSKTEDEFALLRRAKRHKMPCSYCGRIGATVGCTVGNCDKNYHYLCSIADKAEWDDSEGLLYCRSHVSGRIVKSSQSSGFAVAAAERVQYCRKCDWRQIRDADRDALRDCSDSWELYRPLWYNMKLQSPLKVVEIVSPTHWAYCERMAAGKCKQYEVLAARDIYCHEVLDEYVGVVRYLHDIENERDNFYVAQLLWSDQLASSVPPLVIDAKDVGNETRYVNSVSATTPPSVVENARLETVWCRGMPRILLIAIADIRQGEAVVIDYGCEFFDEEPAALATANAVTGTDRSPNKRKNVSFHSMHGYFVGSRKRRFLKK